MGVPTENPVTVQEEYGHHLRYDGVGGNGVAGASFGSSFIENLLGHRSGVGNATPWSTPPVRPTPGFYQDSGPQGGGQTYGAANLTDASKVWPVGSANAGGTVTYGAASLTDTANNAVWVVGVTAQYAGVVVRTATGKLGIIASVAAGVATLAANWQGGTPAAGEAYAFMPRGWVGRTVFAVGTGGALTKGVCFSNTNTVIVVPSWSNGTPANGAAYIIGPDATPDAAARFADNWYATLRNLYNPANL